MIPRRGDQDIMDDDSGAISDSCSSSDSSSTLSDDYLHAMSAKKLRRARREAKERVAGRLHGGREERGRHQPTDTLSFYHRNIRGWLEEVRAHPARRALLVDAKERDYKKAEAMRVTPGDCTSQHNRWCHIHSLIEPDRSDNSAAHRTFICDYDPFEPPFGVFDSWNSYADFVNTDTTLSPDICSHADASNTDV
eukprot:g24608.t1